ncbi:MAG: heparinase II/III family protein [Candidatus Aminicenantales bacterium]
MKRHIFLPKFLFIVALAFMMTPTQAQENVILLGDQLIQQPMDRNSLLDRSRILQGLCLASTLNEAPNEKKLAWKAFIQQNLASLVEALTPSQEPETLEAFSNLLEIHNFVSVPGLMEKLEEWKHWILSPRFIGPENDIGRLGLALILLESEPEAAALNYAQTLLEATIESCRYENEMYRFSVGHGLQALAHLFLSRVIKAPVPTVHERKLRWILLTHYKYLTRKLPEAAREDYHFEEALLEHGLLHHGWVYGKSLLKHNPTPTDLPHYYSVLCRYLAEKQKERTWLSQAKSRPTPRLVVNRKEWEDMIARNKKGEFASELERILRQASEALASPNPLYYEPAPNLDERGKTNDQANAVSRQWNAFRDAYLATGEEKWGRALKEVVLAQVRQFEDYGDFRCYYNLNVPGPWDSLNAVITFTSAYDILSPKALLTEEEKERIIRFIREAGRELEWTLSYSNLIVHNAWARWMGSMGYLTTYWTDLPEVPSWKKLVKSKLPFLYSGIDKDGGWWEKSINYHLFTLDLLEAWASAQKKLEGVDLFNQKINDRSLTMMLDWLIKITPPGGTIPLFNDGQKLNLSQSGPAVRMAQSLGRGDFFKAINFVPRPSCLTPEFRPVEWRTPEFTSILMEESGYAIFRSGWEPDDFYCAIKFGEHGGSHGHYDKASIYVHAFGKPWLIDPGYGQRETFKHNTVVVDGQDQREGAGKLVRWDEGKEVNLITVRHRAYPQTEHERTVLYLKPHSILLIDRLTPLDGKRHTYDWMLQFNSNNGRSSATSWTSQSEGSGIKVFFPENDLEGTRHMSAALNRNELPPNFQKMGNENLYLEIWRGKWTKQTDQPVVFAALIRAFKQAEPQLNLIQKSGPKEMVFEIKEFDKKLIFELKPDGNFILR